MRLGLLLPALLGVIALGAVWIFVLRPDDTASRVRAARERAERVREKGDLPWENPSWREEFDWLEDRNSNTAAAGGGRAMGSTVEALAGSGSPSAYVGEASLPREDSAVAAVRRRSRQAEASGESIEAESSQPTDSDRAPEALGFSVRLLAPSGSGLAQQPVSIRALDDDYTIDSDQPVTDDDGLLHLRAPAGRYQLVCLDGQAEFRVEAAGERIELTVGEASAGD